MHFVEQNETIRPDKNCTKEREKNGAPKLHVLMSGSLVANGLDYSVFIMK
jgi:hypothetical protein